MRILFIHQNFPGQYGHLAAALAENPANTVVALGESTNLQRVAGSYPRMRLVGYAAPQGASASTHHYLQSTEAAVRRGQQVARELLKLRQSGFVPDVVCAHPGWGEALFVKDVFPDAKLHLYAEFFYRGRGSDVDFDPEFRANFDTMCRVRLRNSTQLVSFEAADSSVTPTAWQRAQYPAMLQSAMAVVHDGVDTARAAPDPAATFALANGHLLSRQDEVITFVARNLEPYRGFHVFMRALPGILAARPAARVVIVGGDDVSYGQRAPNGETWRSVLVRETGAGLDPTRVHFTGRMPYPHLLNLLRISSAHVYLTAPFVLSWSMLDAMACGCVVIGSRTPPVEEVIRDGDNGMLVDFFSRTELTERVVEAVANRARFDGMRERARATVMERYDLASHCLPRQIDLITRLAVT